MEVTSGNTTPPFTVILSPSQDLLYQPYPNHHPATLKAAKNRPLTAFSHPNTSQDYQTDWDRRSATGSEAPPGKINVTKNRDQTQDWINDVKFGLNHKHRMKSTNELTDAERPRIVKVVDEDQWYPARDAILDHDQCIPERIANDAANLLGAGGLLDDFESTMVSVVDLPATSTKALLIDVSNIDRFAMPPPFRKNASYTWAPVHGTTTDDLGGRLHSPCKLVLLCQSGQV